MIAKLYLELDWGKRDVPCSKTGRLNKYSEFTSGYKIHTETSEADLSYKCS